MELNEKNKNDPSIARKDINFNNEEHHIYTYRRHQLVTTIVNDAEFFEDQHLMDYSVLLLKLEYRPEQKEEFFAILNSSGFSFYNRFFFLSDKGDNSAYIITIIDYLQNYSIIKKMENGLKNYVLERPQKSDHISCVPPDVYAKRLISYIEKLTDY